MSHTQIIGFIWGIADLIKDYFSRGEYSKVILPFTVLRRLDCVLAPTRKEVREVEVKYESRDLQNRAPQLRRAAGLAFYNTSQYDFDRLCDDSANLAANLRNYINGFSDNMRETLECFDFDNTIRQLDSDNLLFKVMGRFREINLHPDHINNAQMGTIFEELIRKFNEASNENPGQHFTPRDVVGLMTDLMVAGDGARIRQSGAVLTVCDPCCGTGGMLTLAKERIADEGGAEVHLFGQEVHRQTYAICKSDLMMISEDGRDAENIHRRSTLVGDAHPSHFFDYLISNPPYGKDWKQDEEAVKAEYERGGGRFVAGLPRISDGQTLFLQHLIAKMKPPHEGGARAAIIMNGSPLFTGDAGSGESKIRRYVLENDLLEALVALPEQMFYNTGIATYIWVLSNRKQQRRRGKVQLIDARGKWCSLRRSLGDKRREIPPDLAMEIVAELGAFAESETSRIFPTTHFGYRRITIERPLRLNFRASAERIARLEREASFIKLARNNKGMAQQQRIRDMLATLPNKLYRDRVAFAAALDKVAVGVALSAPLYKAILAALSERDPKAEICRGRDGKPEPDPKLRDAERVPLGESIADFFKHEVAPHVADAWIDESKRDRKDGKVGIVGYEINFNRYFYQYTPPRPPTKIMRDFRKVEKEIAKMTADLLVKNTNAVTKGLNPQASMKDSGVPWLGEIPAHWEVKKLKFLASIIPSSVNKKSVVGEPSVRLCNYNDVFYNSEIHCRMNLMSATASEEEIDKFSLRAGDVIITKDSMDLSKIAVPTFVPEDCPDIVCGYHLCILRPKSTVNGRFLFYAVQARNSFEKFLLEATGTTIIGISQYTIGQHLLAIPPRPEQDVIVKILGRRNSEIDRAAANAQESIALLREYRAALIDSAVTGKICLENKNVD